jgi:uncharacterized membrane protein YhaH (DUF805 family)
MGLVVVSLLTAYAFAEFFGVSGRLDDHYKRRKTFYLMYLFQLILVGGIVLFPQISLYEIINATQVIILYRHLFFTISSDSQMIKN